MKCDLRTFDLTSLGVKFDVILVDPPWEEYARRTLGMKGVPHWTLEEIVRVNVLLLLLLLSFRLSAKNDVIVFNTQMKLPVEHIMETQSFAFLWVGSAEGLDQGRAVLAKWGFRRCEDICWVKTNENAPRVRGKSTHYFTLFLLTPPIVCSQRNRSSIRAPYLCTQRSTVSWAYAATFAVTMCVACSVACLLQGVVC